MKRSPEGKIHSQHDTACCIARIPPTGNSIDMEFGLGIYNGSYLANPYRCPDRIRILAAVVSWAWLEQVVQQECDADLQGPIQRRHRALAKPQIESCKACACSA